MRKYTLLISASLLASSLIAKSKQPNILFILADDMGYSDIGAIGGDIQTPTLDKLLKNGTFCRSVYNHSKSEPSRASLLTGVHFNRQTEDHVVREFKNVITIPKLLQSTGYHTICAGKWHLPNQPTDWGFDRFFGLLHGTANNYDPSMLRGYNSRCYLNGAQPFALDGKPYIVDDPNFYSSDAYTDYTIRFLREGPKEKPFFIYLAYTAPHFPLQAPANVVAKYTDKYRDGWDVMRQKRFKHMQQSGLFSDAWKLSASDSTITPWEAYSNKADAATCMAVHAAMVERMDWNIERVITQLREMGELENTLIIFMSDNGPSYQDKRFDHTPEIAPGGAASYRHLPKGFANAVNTPLRDYKLYNTNGGVCSPAVISYPTHITQHKVIDTPLNILDFLPTFAQLAGAKYPKGLLSMDGEDISQILWGKQTNRKKTMFFRLKYIEANQAAVINYPYKACYDTNGWSLFDLRQDMCETQNIGKQQPKVLKKLIEQYKQFEISLPLRNTHETK